MRIGFSRVSILISIVVLSAVSSVKAVDGPASTPTPEPGTEAYYEACVKGKFVLENSKMIAVSPEDPAPPRPVLPSVIRRPPYQSLIPLTGTIEQCIDDETVLIVTEKPLPSGAPERTPHILLLPEGVQLEQGQELECVGRKDDRKRFLHFEGGVHRAVEAFHYLPPVTLETYMAIYEADTAAAGIRKVESVTIAPATSRYRSQTPGVVRPRSSAPAAPGVIRPTPSPTSTNNAVSSTSTNATTTRAISYAERMRARRAAIKPAPHPSTLTQEEREKFLREYNMELIRAGGKKGHPLPIPLTPEEDAQLVKEGVLPPSE